MFIIGMWTFFLFWFSFWYYYYCYYYYYFFFSGNWIVFFPTIFNIYVFIYDHFRIVVHLSIHWWLLHRPGGIYRGVWLCVYYRPFGNFEHLVLTLVVFKRPSCLSDLKFYCRGFDWPVPAKKKVFLFSFFNFFCFVLFSLLGLEDPICYILWDIRAQTNQQPWYQLSFFLSVLTVS